MKMNETKCLSNAKMKVQNTIEQIGGCSVEAKKATEGGSQLVVY